MADQTPTVSESTIRWLQETLTAEEIQAWGAECIRALATLVDSLDKEN